MNYISPFLNMQTIHSSFIIIKIPIIIGNPQDVGINFNNPLLLPQSVKCLNRGFFFAAELVVGRREEKSNGAPLGARFNSQQSLIQMG